ncbi:MAG TPA: DUF1643 domain-containing protein [Acidimicrobiales bacterium]|nr:DUF1643 domain-containing protein [Acidimicrobiales bacterium]
MWGVERTATISDDGIYRYDLTRTLGNGAQAVLVLLNPSTADETSDDPTVAAVLRFAVSIPKHSVGTVTIVNLFALRTTDPALLRSHPDPVGPDNDATIARHLRDADIIVVGWGEQGSHFSDRVTSVLRFVASHQLWCFGTTSKGHPRHPQRLGRSTPLVPFDPVPLLQSARRRTSRNATTGPSEAVVVAGFSTWLRSRGWDVETEVDWADVVATRGVERLVAEAKGSTLAPNLDIDTGYGQLLRRMSDDSDGVRYAIVVPERHVAGALRVPEAIRRTLQLDVYGVDDAGNVTAHLSR